MAHRVHMDGGSGAGNGKEWGRKMKIVHTVTKCAKDLVQKIGIPLINCEN